MSHDKITEQQVADFDRDGFLIIKDFVSKEQIAQLRTRMKELIDAGFDLNKHSASVFSTEKDDVRVNAHESHLHFFH